MSRYLEDNETLNFYVSKIQGYETLSFEEEQSLAKRWKEKKDRSAANKLINAHLRLVVKVASGFKGYGLPMNEIIQEGNIGLMQAITKFEPEKGFRLSTYAMWWIKASIQEYVLHSWSLVKIGTTAAQKKLFFNLRKLRNQLQDYAEEGLTRNTVKEIAKKLDVKESEVLDMDQRINSNDQSLNATITNEVTGEWLDWLADDRPNQEETYAEDEIFTQRHKVLVEALKELNDRERDIFIARNLKDDTLTLEDLSVKYGISRERVRQLENRAFEKVQKFMTTQVKA